MTTLADFFVVCSAESTRQVRAIADAVHEAFAKEGRKPLGIEGLEESSWVLLDFNDFILHIFLTDRRGFYDLERLWADAPRLTLKSSRTKPAEDRVANRGGLSV